MAMMTLHKANGVTMLRMDFDDDTKEYNVVLAAIDGTKHPRPTPRLIFVCDDSEAIAHDLFLKLSQGSITVQQMND